MSESSPKGSTDSEPSLRQGSSLRVAELDAASLRSKVAAKLFGIDAEPVKIGAYTVLKRLGSGGMGIVYSAYDERLDRKVAIKVMRGPKDSLHHAQRLVREARALAQLSHPNVVQVYEVGEFRGQVYIAMEYLPGMTLRQHSRQESKKEQSATSIAEKLKPWIQAAKGLSAAHQAGLVHRDFKPENVMVLEDGRVKVFDFGLSYFVEPTPLEAKMEIARQNENAESLFDPSNRKSTAGVSVDDHILHPLLRSRSESADGLYLDTRPRAESTHRSQSSHSRLLTKPGVTIGTPAYMAPEQLLGARGDAQSDQFSFCISVWESLCGKRPYSGENTEQLAKQISAHRPNLPLRESLPLWLRRVLLRGLSPDPKHRYPTMTAVIADIEANLSKQRYRKYAAAAMIPVVLCGSLFAYAATQRETPCKEISHSWSELDQEIEHKSAALLSSSNTPLTIKKSLGILQDYVKQAAETHQTTCEEADRKHTWSESQFAQKASCFENTQNSARLFLNRIMVASDGQIERAPWLALSLPSVEACTKIASTNSENIDKDTLALRKATQEKLAQAQIDAEFLELIPALKTVNEVVDTARANDFDVILAKSLLLRGTIHHETNRNIKERSQDLSTAYRIAEKIGDPGLRLKAATLRADLRRHAGDGKTALDQLRDVYALAERDDIGASIRVHYFERACTTERQNGHTCRARELCEEGLARLDENELTNPYLRSEIERRLAWIAFELGDINTALRHANKALDLRKELLGNDSPLLASTLSLLGSLQGEKLRMKGSTDPEGLDQAIANTKKAYEHFVSIHGHSSSRTLVSAQNYGEFLRRRGRFAESEAVFRKLLESLPDEPRIPLVRLNFGHLRIQQGEIEEGKKILLQVLRELDNMVEKRYVDRPSALYPEQAEILTILAMSSSGRESKEYADRAADFYRLLQKESEHMRGQSDCAVTTTPFDRYESERRALKNWRDEHLN